MQNSFRLRSEELNWSKRQVGTAESYRLGARSDYPKWESNFSVPDDGRGNFVWVLNLDEPYKWIGDIAINQNFPKATDLDIRLLSNDQIRQLY
jgi:hypothetical protein